MPIFVGVCAQCNWDVMRWWVEQRPSLRPYRMTWGIERIVPIGLEPRVGDPFAIMICAMRGNPWHKRVLMGGGRIVEAARNRLMSASSQRYNKVFPVGNIHRRILIAVNPLQEPIEVPETWVRKYGLQGCDMTQIESNQELVLGKIRRQLLDNQTGL